MVTTPTFGAWLKQRRRALDLTQGELADQVGCSVETIYKIEADSRRPSKQIAQRLADALALPPGEKSNFIRMARGGAPWTSAAVSLAPQPGALDLGGGSPSIHLPMPPTTLVGRTEEIAAVTALLCRRQVRLLTLTGPGGIGKTRLAIQVAWSLLPEFEHGIYFVPLASLRKTSLIVPTILQSLGVDESIDQDLLQQLKNYLREKRLLLVLDNLEHLIEPLLLVGGHR